MHTFLTMIIEESVCFMSCEPIFFLQLFLCGTHGIYIQWYIFFHQLNIAHIICITVLENRIICCQIFCDLLLKSAFERIFNVMQLILGKIKWHIKWKYLIQKFHDIDLSYKYAKVHPIVFTNVIAYPKYVKLVCNLYMCRVHL